MTQLIKGDCLEVLDNIPDDSIDLVYADPPFFTQTVHRLSTRDGEETFSFADVWDSDSSYANFIFQRLSKIREKMKATGSIFFHCDKSASHIIRLMLDSVFGPENFQSEIIWHFRRWSNAKRGLLNSHQTIYFYSKSQDFKFFQSYCAYSESTNIDQIMQKRARDHRNKSVYARNNGGEVISNGAKKGVPLGDVWEIPFLNPKAKERVGYPTQKPVLLLKKIIELVTEPGDLVLDPFCGSGTTLVAAQLLEREAIGIDVENQAIELSSQRLANPIVTESALLERGRASYQTHDKEAEAHLQGIDYTPVQRNRGIDGLLKREIGGKPVFVRVQRHSETQNEAADALRKACENKGECIGVVVVTKQDLIPPKKLNNVFFVRSATASLAELISDLGCAGEKICNSVG
ncbi:DNA-methyltransferase [Paracoccus denitrificans]|uniref:DNA-methyltransferase n=1 Tax=Paracoccus denitrificans TaxID=266 RepID=UPI003364F2C5